MRQYNQVKQKHPDALLLFRVGDFYETFGEDAIKASQILGIVLTKRSNGSASEVELAGFPHHSLEAYLPKLVRAGQRVAICDQLEDPKLTKKIVKRGITELVTPGVTTNDNVLQGKQNNFLCAVSLSKSGSQGIAFCDISTGEFYTAQGSYEYLEKLIQSLAPTEILYPKAKSALFAELFGNRYYSFAMDDWIFKHDYAYDNLLQHFKVSSLKGFGVENLQEAIIACGAIFHYLKDTRHDQLQHIGSLKRIDEKQFVWMDRFTIRNLELFQANAPDGKSLIDVVDHSKTPMGGRLLRRWLAMPLLDVKAIRHRHAAVGEWLKQPAFAEDTGDALAQIHDLERLVSKLSTRKILPRELVQLKDSITRANYIKNSLPANCTALQNEVEGMEPCLDLIATLTNNLVEEPSNNPQKGRVIAEGVSEELDELNTLLHNGKSKLLEIQQKEAQRTGIATLKIAFNNVFGYYLEVRNTHKDKVPPEWIRKQTLVSAERYITEELKEYEQKILGAEDKIVVLQQDLYQQLLEKVGGFLDKIQHNAQVLARLDCLLGFADLAQKNNYNCPEMVEGSTLEITGGRHPVIEQSLPEGQEYVANNLTLNRDTQQIMMITGPNMSGKSALLRQAALITLLAQIGCYVPAQSAKLGCLDKIFVRVGASDNISQGESTFMVEMNETASILNNLSEGSLVLLDEIGRGTSTYDGISIAWSIAEFIHNHPSRAKTLFATHYHELNEMGQTFERIKNFNVSVKEVGKDILFMRKLVEGGSEHSFGLHVAKLAGMPALVINKARQILKKLEKSRGSKKEVSPGKEDMQLSFFQLDDPMMEEIRTDIADLDIDTLTPVEALMKLNEIKKKIGA